MQYWSSLLHFPFFASPLKCMLLSTLCEFASHLFFYNGQAHKANISQPELPDWLWSNSALSCHHCHSLACYHSHCCRCSLQPSAMADRIWLLSLLRHHSSQDVESVLHLQQPKLTEEKGAHFRPQTPYTPIMLRLFYQSVGRRSM